MRYLLLIYTDENFVRKLSPTEGQQMMAAFMRFGEELKQAGAWIGSDRLRPVATATTVRVRDGQRLTTDGPFAETKEQLGGYYLINAGNLDEALAWAAKIPSAKHGSIEVRPIWEVGPEGYKDN
jgi:hypothetical protein